jgi:hypothetical protein
MIKSSKIKFKDKIWIIGNYKGEEVIGRTCTIQGMNYVSIVTSKGRITIVAFETLGKIKKLILPKTLPAITTSIQNIKSKTFMDEHILETLTFINNN